MSEAHIIAIAVLIPSVILHEISHGWVALAFGDDTAKRAGRLTLNPIAHIDPFGTIILPALLILTTGRAFGYAKPVPVNVGKLRSPRNQGLLVSLAGPAVNKGPIGAACPTGIGQQLLRPLRIERILRARGRSMPKPLA